MTVLSKSMIKKIRKEFGLEDVIMKSEKVIGMGPALKLYLKEPLEEEKLRKIQAFAGVPLFCYEISKYTQPSNV